MLVCNVLQHLEHRLLGIALGQLNVTGKRFNLIHCALVRIFISDTSPFCTGQVQALIQSLNQVLIDVALCF